MPEAQLTIAVAAPGVDFSKGGLRDAVLHSAAQLNYLFGYWQSRELYSFEGENDPIDENKGFSECFPLFAGRVLPVEC